MRPFCIDAAPLLGFGCFCSLMDRIPCAIDSKRDDDRVARNSIDPVKLEVFHHLLSAYCDEAGARLRLSAISPNIRERADYSVAVFDREARLVAQAAHIPVHLASGHRSHRNTP